MMLLFIKMEKSIDKADLFCFLILFGEEKTRSQKFYFKLDKLEMAVMLTNRDVK